MFLPLSLQEGWTPLHIAVQSGRLDVIKLLLSRGADTSIKNKVYSLTLTDLFMLEVLFFFFYFALGKI
jgi:ankyrin repeat protein